MVHRRVFTTTLCVRIYTNVSPYSVGIALCSMTNIFVYICIKLFNIYLFTCTVVVLLYIDIVQYFVHKFMYVVMQVDISLRKLSS